MLQYGYWPGGEEETLGTANPPCAGSIPASASRILKSIDFVLHSDDT